MKIKNYVDNKAIVFNDLTRTYFWRESGEPIYLFGTSKIVEIEYPYNGKANSTNQNDGIQRWNCVYKRMSSFIEKNSKINCLHSRTMEIKIDHNNCFDWLKSEIKKIDYSEIYFNVTFKNSFYIGTVDILYKDDFGKWHIINFKTSYNMNKSKEALKLILIKNLVEFQKFDDLIQIDSLSIYNASTEKKYSLEILDTDNAENKVTEIIDRFKKLSI